MEGRRLVSSGSGYVNLPFLVKFVSKIWVEFLDWLKNHQLLKRTFAWDHLLFTVTELFESFEFPKRSYSCFSYLGCLV